MIYPAIITTLLAVSQVQAEALHGVNGGLHLGVDPARAVDAMNRAGFNSMRLEFPWKLVEKRAAIFAWPPELERQRKAVSLQKASGLKPLVILDYGNPLYPGTGQSQAFIDGFTRYATWLATELKGSVHHFEVWNEWNGGMGLPCTYKEPGDICTGRGYAKLLCPVYAALKKVDPSIVVVGGATSGLDNRFIDDLIDAGAAKCLDVLSMHMYYYNNYFRNKNNYYEPPEVTLAKLHALHQRLKPIVGEIPFYITETGVTVFPGSGHTESGKTDYLTRFSLAAKAYPFIQGIWIYVLTDLNARNLFQSSFGLMQRDFTPKLSYSAMQDVLGLSKSEYLGRVESPADVWLLKFRDPEGDLAYALWTTGSRTSTRLIFGTPKSLLHIKQVGEPQSPAVPFKAGANTITVTVSSATRVLRAQGANIDIMEVVSP